MESASSARALWFEAPGRAAIRPAALPPLGPGQARVRTLFSGVSRGTERLVFTGKAPPSEHARMRCPMQEGEFSFPVKYGYCAVGITEEGPAELLGRPVFALHPHQSGFVADSAALRPLPDGLPPRRAVLSANMETALNALWDSGAGPGDRVVIVGAGIVGMLTAWLAARLPGADVTLVDVEPARADAAARIGVPFMLAGDFYARGCAEADAVFHASASAPGLALAIASAGMEAKIIEMSWYGEGAIAAPLGGAFHSRRLQLISTQVGQVSPSRRSRWDYARRMAKAMELLRDDRLDALLDVDVAFEDMPARAAEIFAPGAKGLGVVVRY
ncbi:MAG: zinc-binding alcohol dehydrogenase [Beijerinckiaceae bacterium]|nr:zinc-binding alcohol dehydrogenase [Beijerinckiaceae bacterium]